MSFRAGRAPHGLLSRPVFNLPNKDGILGDRERLVKQINQGRSSVSQSSVGKVSRKGWSSFTRR